MESQPLIRWMIRRDLEQVVAIERHSFFHPWPEEEFIRALRHRSVIGKVLERREQILGYAIFELQAKSLILLNLAVDFDARRRGVGRALIEDRVRAMSSRRSRMFLRVADYNLSGQQFARAVGFRAEGIDAGHFEDFDGASIDAIRFAYRFQPSSRPANREEEPVGTPRHGERA